MTYESKRSVKSILVERLRLGRAILFRRRLDFVLHLGLIFALFLLIRNELVGSGILPLWSSYLGFSDSVTRTWINFPLIFNLQGGYFSSTTWIAQLPVTIPQILVTDSVIGTKTFLLTILAEYYSISYFTASLFYKTFELEENSSQERKSIFIFLCILIMFVNYTWMYSFASGSLPFLFGLPLILYVLIKLYRIWCRKDQRLMDIFKILFIVVLCSLADPRYFVFFTIILSVFVVALSFRYGPLSVALNKKSLTPLVLIPCILFIYVVFTFNQPGGYVSARPLSVSEIDYFSKSVPFLSYFQAMGEFWPAFTRTSPSVLFIPSENWSNITVVGSPAVSMILTDPLSLLWFFTTFAQFIVFISAALIKKERILNIFYLSALLFFSISMGTYFPIPQFVESYISEVMPVIIQDWSSIGLE